MLESCAKATRENREDDILKNHAPDLVIFDVLPPMKYDSAAAYRASWGDWQPEIQGEGQFALENRVVNAMAELAMGLGYPWFCPFRRCRTDGCVFHAMVNSISTGW